MDINDAFDSIIFSEESVGKNGFHEGLSKGEHSGLIEGYHFGFHRGTELGKEVGFYTGFVETMLCNTEGISPKLKSLLLKFQTSLLKVPHANNDTVDFERLLQELRSFYKAACSLSGLDSILPIDLSPLKY